VTTISDIAPVSVPTPMPVEPAGDHRGSFIPSGAMITSRIMELRKRRGLMITLILVTVGIPSVFLVIRLILHAAAPHSYGPAGGDDIFSGLVAGVLYIFGFVLAATVGCTAGSVDLTEGMFRHLVVTGRSRLALYLSRIPAGLAVVLPIVAIGFTIVCAVCVFAAPTQFTYQGVPVPMGLSQAGFENWAAHHPDQVICNFPYDQPTLGIPCGNGGPGRHGVASVRGAVVQTPPGVTPPSPPSAAALRAQAITIARTDYGDYTRTFLYPPISLMIRSGLWIELEATIGFLVGLGLASLLGQRTVPVILMIVLEIVLTPILSTAKIPGLINLQRALVGLAEAHLEPSGLTFVFGGGGGGPNGNQGTSLLVPETRAVAVCVIVAWLVVWTVLGAWRMMRRDA
jgi:hypothetical protein